MLQPLEGRVVTPQRRRQTGAIDRPVHDHAGKGLTDRFYRCAADAIELMHCVVGVPDDCALVGEHAGGGGFAHADGAGQTDDDHAASPRRLRISPRTSMSGGETPKMASNEGLA